MKTFITALLVFFTTAAFAQPTLLLKNRQFFSNQLKPWVRTFPGLMLKDFVLKDSSSFANGWDQEFKDPKKFLSIYKPLMSFSPDSTSFIDPYSYQLGLVKKKGYYEVNGEIDQGINIYDRRHKYWKQIFFGGMNRWIDETQWVSATQFLLVGMTRDSSDRDKRLPMILVGDTDTQMLYHFFSTDTSIYQNAVYGSAKLKRMKIRGL